MKIFTLILCCYLMLFSNASAELYHGIDIDKVYQNSDWSSKEKIKEIINDYTLLIQYQKELSLCSKTTEQLSCMDKLAKNILKQFYSGSLENNINNYLNYVRSTSTAYGMIYCLNRYRVPSGSICNQENDANTVEHVKKYIQEQLNSIEKVLSNYSFIENYKD